MQTQAHTLRYRSGAHGSPASRSEGQQRAGKGSALDLCLEEMGAHRSADPCREGCELELPPTMAQPACCAACSEEGKGAWPCVDGG